jgi:hypothetical protein
MLRLTQPTPACVSQKWSKGKLKEKVNNLVLFDQVRTVTMVRAAREAAGDPHLTPIDPRFAAGHL